MTKNPKVDNQQYIHLNKAANIVLTVPRFDKSTSMSMPSASRA